MVNVPRFCSADSLVIRGIWKSSIMSPNVVLVSHRRRQDAGSGHGPDLGAAQKLLLLLRVQLDDELLLHRRGDLTPLRLAQNLGRERLVVGL